MIYLKGLIGGTIFALGGGLLTVVAIVIYFRLRHHAAIDIALELLYSRPVIAFLLLLFLGGFWLASQKLGH